MSADTIAAIATPQGAGGIAMLRISGPEAFAVAGRIFLARSGRALARMRGYSGALGHIVDGEQRLDEAIVFVYRAPKSYTGEDVVEFTLHGGMWVAARALRLCFGAGAIPAGPGEFTKRAFLNGRLDLAQAEAVMDIISADGDAALRAAVHAHEGRVSTAVREIVKNILAQSAHLAAWSDYPDEGLEDVDTAVLAERLLGARGLLEELIGTYDQGKILREGVAAAIVGRPNAGKSTLMNLLSGFERSIVTEIPGTTRDVVSESVRIGDVTLQLFDTAGIRETDDPVERVGVARAKEQIQRAGLILAVFDNSDELGDSDRELLAMLGGRPCIALINKTDLPARLDTAEIRRLVPRVVMMSAKTGEGSETLRKEIEGILHMERLGAATAVIASERQYNHLCAARQALDQALDALASGVTLDAVNVCLDDALNELLSLTGERAGDRVIGEVFARFCVGK